MKNKDNRRDNERGEMHDDKKKTDGAHMRKIYDSPYQVVVHHCESCGKSRIHTDRGALEVDRSLFERAICDGKVLKLTGNGEGEKGEKNTMGQNRRSVGAALRQKILLRDEHTCQVPGCTHSQFLEVHHIIPRHSMQSSCHMETLNSMETLHRGRSVGGQKKDGEAHDRGNAKTTRLTQDCTHREVQGINAPTNMVSVCSRCHRLIHEGKIMVKGAAPEVRWFHEKGIPFEEKLQ
jgi:5-methylcytosine-specific restriction endonuclease McrA